MNTVKIEAGSPIKAMSLIQAGGRTQGLLLEVLRYWRPTDH